MEKIGQIIERIIKNIDLNNEENRVSDVSIVWTRIMDDKFKGKCYVLYEKDKNLYVKVNGSCYLSILKMKKKEILNRLSQNGFNFLDIKFLI